MLRVFVTCESDAGCGRRRAFICFFCSGHFARPQRPGKVSCLRLPLISLAPSDRRPCLRAEVSIARTSLVLRSGATPLDARNGCRGPRSV